MTPQEAVLVLRVRDELLKQDEREAWHWLYVLAHLLPNTDPFEPWQEMERLAATAPSDFDPERVM